MFTNNTLSLHKNADELKLKAFDVLLWHYNKLYIEMFAGGGVNQEEFEELKCLFVEACQMAKTLLEEFVRKYDDAETDDFDLVLERVESWGVIHYAYYWKAMYHKLLPCVEENKMTSKDKDHIFSAYDLLKIANYTLAAWYILEKENGITGKDNPGLLRQLYNYLAWHSEGPFWYEYPEVPFTRRAKIWDMAQHNDYGDIDSDNWEYCVENFFENKMEEYMAEHHIQYPLTIPSVLEDRIITSRSYMLEFYDEIEVCIISAMEANRALEIVYYSFENGASHFSVECIMPIKMINTSYYWTLTGKGGDGQTKEYVVRQIIEAK